MSREAAITMPAPMIRALLAGRKSQTRRVIEPQPFVVHQHPATGQWTQRSGADDQTENPVALRYAPGDRLWVRERIVASAGLVQYEADGKRTKQLWPAEWKQSSVPPQSMRRQFSRFTLMVEDVRVARLNDCGPDDARAEGLEWVFPTWGVAGLPETWHADPSTAYASFWDHMHGPGAWSANPWVAVVNFKALDENASMSLGNMAA